MKNLLELDDDELELLLDDEDELEELEELEELLDELEGQLVRYGCVIKRGQWT